jgi:hypothetical protein
MISCSQAHALCGVDKEEAMPKGLYRDSGGWVRVNYEDRFMAFMHRSDYENHDYKPQFEALPMKEKYERGKTAQAQQKS